MAAIRLQTRRSTCSVSFMLRLAGTQIAMVVAVDVRREARLVVHPNLPERGVAVVDLSSLDVGFQLGDGEDANTGLAIQLVIKKPPDVPVLTPAVLAAVLTEHTTDAAGTIGGDLKVAGASPSPQNDQHRPNLSPGYGLATWHI